MNNFGGDVSQKEWASFQDHSCDTGKLLTQVVHRPDVFVVLVVHMNVWATIIPVGGQYDVAGRIDCYSGYLSQVVYISGNKILSWAQAVSKNRLHWGLEYWTFEFQIHSKFWKSDFKWFRFRNGGAIAVVPTIQKWNYYTRIEKGGLMVRFWMVFNIQTIQQPNSFRPFEYRMWSS